VCFGKAGWHFGQEAGTMHTVTLLGVGAVVVAVIGTIVYLGRPRKHSLCVGCGAAAQFGYSLHAESDKKDIASVCLSCLMARLAKDYEQFDGRALVIEPAPKLPCYVFQPSSKWKDCKLVREADDLLSKMKNSCSNCGARANFLWLTSNGLQPNNQEKLFDEGLSETLFRWDNSLPRPVCGRCCVKLINSSIESRALTFLEVCGPHSDTGFVLPMGY
jgi:hypothetical protein